jgi:type IV pilus assembly protein PilO
MIDWRRMLQEKRSLVLPLAVAAVVNVGVYLLAVYPLTARTASVEARAQAASVARANALGEFNAAEATRTGRARADQQLTRFYAEILPRDYVGARRITYLRLAKLAEDANLDYDRRNFNTKQDRESVLEQLDGSMTLTGEYRDVRRFLHALDTAPEFVVIKSVSLMQDEGDKALRITLQLGTWYRAQP